jgi:biopolymer transport protein ExbB
MFEIVKAGGIVMVPIILCSILAVAITLERLWTLREQRVVPAELTDKVWQWVENRALSDK